MHVSEPFKTRSLLVETSNGRVHLNRRVAMEDTTWYIDGERVPDLNECTDIDIEASPVRNTIAIKRWKLKVGEHITLIAAWVYNFRV
jgi:hypothetical protein